MSRAFTVLMDDQRSDAWRQARLGRLTGSVAGDMLAKIKSGEAAARRDLRLRLVCERLTGQSQEDGYVNTAMQRGIDLEPAAFAAYEARTGQMVERSGFLAHNDLMAGCSLDGHLGDFEGLIELKCPKSSAHLRYLRAGLVPSDYLPQVTHNLWITGAAWAEFCSFDDRFPPPLQFFRVRVIRGDLDLKAYEVEALRFLKEIDDEVAAVRELGLEAVAV